jgi:hypothetical protein
MCGTSKVENALVDAEVCRIGPVQLHRGRNQIETSVMYPSKRHLVGSFAKDT